MPTKKLNYSQKTGHHRSGVKLLDDEQRKTLGKVCQHSEFAGRIIALAAHYAWDAENDRGPKPAEVQATLAHFRSQCADLLDKLWHLPVEASRTLRAGIGEDLFCQFDSGLRAAAKADDCLAPCAPGRGQRNAERTAALELRGLFQLHNLKYCAAQGADGSNSDAVKCLQVIFDISRIRSSTKQPKKLADETIMGYVKSAMKVKIDPSEIHDFYDLESMARKQRD